MSSCQSELFSERCFLCNGWTSEADPCYHCNNTGDEEVRLKSGCVCRYFDIPCIGKRKENSI